MLRADTSPQRMQLWLFLMGSVSLNVEPTPSVESRPMLPLSSLAICLQMDSPRPVPGTNLLSLTKRSKMCSCSFLGMPQPVSATLKQMVRSSPTEALMVIVPRAVCFMAFVTKLLTTCDTRPRSDVMLTFSGSSSRRISTSLFRFLMVAMLACSCSSALTSKVENENLSWLRSESMRDMSSTSLTS